MPKDEQLFEALRLVEEYLTVGRHLYETWESLCPADTDDRFNLLELEELEVLNAKAAAFLENYKDL